MTTHLIHLGGHYHRIRLLYAGWILMVLSLTFAIFWRILSQLFMEQEVFGPDTQVSRYYKLTGDHKTFTSSFKYTSRNKLYHRMAVALQYLTALAFIGGLFLLGAFFAANLGSG